MIKKNKNNSESFQKKVIAIVLAGALIAGVGYLAVMQRILDDRVNELSTIKIGSLILEAVDNLNDPLPINPQTGEKYIPEARLRLPANSSSSNRLEYYYSAESVDMPEEVRLASTTALASSRTKIMSATSQEALFAAVPRLQACSRGYRITFKNDIPIEDGLTVVLEKTLKDGRFLRVLEEEACDMPDYFDISYLKQIDSY